jgi:hypothetical protein
MKKSELKILEKVWEAEINSAFCAHGIHLLQTKSKVAQKLAKEGFLNFSSVTFKGVVISGYELTHLGRLTYCASV